MQCIHNYVDQQTGNDCPKCSARATKTTIKVCALYASEFGTEIGSPSNLNDPYLPKWEKGRPVWGSLYEGYNLNANVNRPGVFCRKRPNDINTFCTQLSIKETEITDIFRTREQSLRDELLRDESDEMSRNESKKKNKGKKKPLKRREKM
jgi:hypothetical protein